MPGRLSEGEHRRKADIGAFHDAAPFLAGLGPEDRRELLLENGPGGALHLGIESLVRQAGELAQLRVKLRLDRSDRDEIAAGALIDAVKMRPAIEKVVFAALDPAAGRGEIEKHRH